MWWLKIVPKDTSTMTQTHCCYCFNVSHGYWLYLPYLLHVLCEPSFLFTLVIVTIGSRDVWPRKDSWSLSVSIFSNVKWDFNVLCKMFYGLNQEMGIKVTAQQHCAWHIVSIQQRLGGIVRALAESPTGMGYVCLLRLKRFRCHSSGGQRETSFSCQSNISCVRGLWTVVVLLRNYLDPKASLAPNIMLFELTQII